MLKKVWKSSFAKATEDKKGVGGGEGTSKGLFPRPDSSSLIYRTFFRKQCAAGVLYHLTTGESVEGWLKTGVTLFLGGAGAFFTGSRVTLGFCLETVILSSPRRLR